MSNDKMKEALQVALTHIEVTCAGVPSHHVDYASCFDDRKLVMDAIAALSSQDNASASDPSTAAIEYALKTDDGLAFLRCWLYGDFDAIRSEWPEAPEAVFIGADPLHKGVKE